MNIFLKNFSNNYYYSREKKKRIKSSNLLKKQKEIFKLSNDIFNQLVRIFEKNYKNKHKKNFWKIYLYPWVFFFVCDITDRYNLVLDNKFKKHDFKININIGELIFNSSKEYILSFQNNKKTNYLFCNIIFNILTKKKSKIKFNPKPKIAQKNFILKKFLLILYKYIIPSNDFILRSFGFKSFLLNLLLYKKVLFPKIDLNINKDLDLNFRKRINIKFKRKKEIYKIINFLIPFLIPKNFIENFDLINKNIQKYFPLNVSNIYTESSIWQEDVIRFWAGVNKSKGSNLNFFQHGGGYTEKINSQVELEYLLSDKHFIFANKNRKKEKQYTDKIFLRIKNINRPKNNKILFPISFVQNFNKDFQFPKCTDFNLYYSEVFQFLDNINDDVQDNITIRLMPNIDEKNVFIKILRKRYPNLNIQIPIDNINKSLRDYKLFVGSINSTTLIQAFLSGIPSIHFLDDSYFLPKNNYKKYYDRLKKEKILFNNGKSAAKFLNKKFRDNIYWSSNRLKYVRKDFIKNIIYKNFN